MRQSTGLLVHIFFGFLVVALFVLGNLDLFLSLVCGSCFVAGGIEESWVISGRRLHGNAPRLWQSLVCWSGLWLLDSTVDTCLRQFTEAFGVFLAVQRWTRTLPVVVQRQVPVVPRSSLHAALVVDNGGMAGVAGSDASHAVLAFPSVFP